MSNHSSSAIRILLLEDSPQDAELVTRALQRSDPRFEVLHVDRASTFREALAEREPDVVLSDRAVVDFNALDALRMTQSARPAVPFLLVFATFEQTAADCLKAGAADFIRKTDLSRLVPSIASALELRIPLRKLSQRQRQVLRLMAEGWSTREIAGELEVSIKTVETHRAEVMKRLGVRDLASLVRYAIRIGIGT
jgi:DNA-binding NarL/FixJ family response regulator